MASAARTFTRSAHRAAPAVARSTARNARFQPLRRGYASESTPPPKSNFGLYGTVALAALAAGGSYYLTNTESGKSILAKVMLSKPSEKTPFAPKLGDYQGVYNHIAKLLEEKDDYDDGSYGPVLVRLAWHASGTYDKETGTGGSNGATMRFAPEGDHGANAGLKHARYDSLGSKLPQANPVLSQPQGLPRTSQGEIPMDFLLRSVDSCGGMRHSRNAGSNHSVATRSS